LIAGSFCYSAIGLNSLNNRVDSLSDKLNSVNSALASTTADLRLTISETHNILSGELNQERQNVGAIKEQLGTYQEKVGNVVGTVETLQKLSKTDPQLLQKYSKVFFLNEYYAPARLSEIPATYQYSESKHLKIHTDVWPHMQDMLSDAAKEGLRIYVFSAYRSFNEQQALKGQYSVTYGAGTANAFSADQGYSEHQLGTTADFITTGLNGNLDGFDGTKAYPWLKANAYKYGFVLSYPENNKFYVFEPWHWRYVGIKLATYLHNQNINFYDMDQRKIDEYLVNVFE
jgi:LAS superfamily LD-carboxypeptidase LdcB